MIVITITEEQQAALLKVSMDSFKESGSRQSLRDQDKWWADNILNGKSPYRIDRVSGTTFHVFMDPE